ncbi:MAG TPA: cytochrome c biogenesis protein ResB [Pyrinomonadaceae bacterium]|jgi:cytochrome c biogenesis protein
MSAIEETKREISVPAAAQVKPKPTGTATTPSPAERAITLAVCVALVVVVRLVVGEGMSTLDIGVMLALSVAVAGVGVQRLIEFLSSVRFGVSLLVLLVVACMIGMIIMQVNVDGFENYYTELTPAQRLLYGNLGFFDIYHSRYFNFLLLILSLNIVLASIDRFPKAWTFISRRKLDASAHWLRGQEQHAAVETHGASRSEVGERVAAAYRAQGFKPTITEKGTKTFVFAERGAWNRLGAYAVHVALLTIFTGGFLTAQFGRVGQMPLKPGATASDMSEIVFKIDDSTQEFAPTRASFELPFEVACTDIQQKLIKKEGTITADNTLDWLTWIKIRDKTDGTERDALVHLNHPYDYRGYRFFQASFQAHGQAREIKLRLTPEAGGETQDIVIKRDGETSLPDGTRITFAKFFPDFTFKGGSPTSASDDYNNPAAMLSVVRAGGGQPERAFAFANPLPEGLPVGAAKGGYKFQLVDFEKVPAVHILSVQHDPGANIVYLGFLLLALTLCAVFFFSHQRVWAQIEERSGDGGASIFEVVLGGNTNRNKLGFEDRFKRLVKAVGGDAETEVKQS